MNARLCLPILLLLAACTQSQVASEPTPPAPAASQPDARTAPAAPREPAPTPAPAPEPVPAPATDSSAGRQQVACTEPRPEVCTAMYDPVCATRDTGVRCITTPCPSTEQKTMGNSCSACSDPKVYSWVKGECPAP